MRPLAFSSTDLPLIQSQLEGWRQRQSGRSRLPPELWDAATALARTEGVSRVARVLKLGFYRLQREVRTRPLPVSVKDAANAFIELKLDSPPPPDPASGWVELMDGSDRRMRLHTGHDPAAWVALARSFWRSPP